VKGDTVRAFSSLAECPVDRVKKEPGKVENMVDGAVDRERAEWDAVLVVDDPSWTE
jgi:hypothetical protein